MENGERGEVDSKPKGPGTCSWVNILWWGPHRRWMVSTWAWISNHLQGWAFLPHVWKILSHYCCFTLRYATEQSLSALKQPPTSSSEVPLTRCSGHQRLFYYGESWGGARTNLTTVLSISTNNKSVKITWGTKFLTHSIIAFAGLRTFPVLWIVHFSRTEGNITRIRQETFS